MGNKKKVVVVLDNDECTGQYVMASVFHSHIVNNFPDSVDKNSENYKKLVNLFSDYYLKINGINPSKKNIGMVGCARPGTFFLLRLLQNYKKLGIIHKVVMYTSASNEDNWVYFLKDCLENYSNSPGVFDLVFHRETFPNAKVAPSGATMKDLEYVFKHNEINPEKLTKDNFKIIMLDDNPQNIKKSGVLNYRYGVSPYHHMIGKNNLRKFIQILFDNFKIKDKRNFFQEIINDPDFKLTDNYEQSNDTEIIEFMQFLNKYIVK
jgi:hypothetical protein